MKKIVIGKLEAEITNIVMGAVVTAGLGCIAIGVKNLFDVKKIKRKAAEPVDEEAEFEEYKEKKKQNLNKKKNRKMRKGIIGIALGSFIAAVGVAAFTPLRSFIVNDDFSLKKDKIYLLNSKIQDAKEAAELKFQDAKTLADGKFSDAKEIINNVKKIKKIVDKIESKIA